MWAVVEINKKQYKVAKGDILPVQRLKQEGDIVFDKVLLLSKGKTNEVEIGKPYVKGAVVKAKILDVCLFFRSGQAYQYATTL